MMALETVLFIAAAEGAVFFLMWLAGHFSDDGGLPWL